MATASIMEEVGDYEIDIHPRHSLGEGRWGKVYVGRHVKSGKEVAAKVIEWEKDLVTEEMDQEANMMKSISEHPNVLRIIDYIKKEVVKKRVIVEGWIIVELCTLGNVVEYAEKKELSIVQKVDLILQGSRGVQHLHNQKPSIIHHDVKLANLLVTGSKDDPIVKVGDFGISKFFAHSRDQSMTKRFREGTENYWAPEMFRLDKDNLAKYNKGVDIFGMGISALTLVEEQHGKSIFTYTVKDGEKKKGLGRRIYEKKSTNVAALISKSGVSEEVKRFKTIIASMLAKDAQKRLTIHGVVDRLTQLRSELGVQTKTLKYQVDTVWTPGKLNVNKEFLETAESRANMREVVEKLTRMLLEDEEERRKNTLMFADIERQNTLWIHDGGEWSSVDVPDECQRDCPCVGYVSDGLVLAGGETSCYFDASPECYHFSLSKREWRRLQDMITPNVKTSTVEMTDMKLMVAGAYNNDRCCHACEILDVRTGEWSSASPLPDGMSGDVVLGAVGGRAYTLGKTTSSGVRFLEYDPELDTHTTKPSPPVTLDTRYYIRAIATLAGVAGEILLVCKDVDKVTHVLQYDPSTQQWHQLEPPTTYLPDWISSLTIVKEDRVLLCGTSRAPTQDERNLIEEYNIHTQKGRVLDIRLPFIVKKWYCG